LNQYEDQNLPIEVTVDFAAKYLCTTERTIINYLKSRQLKGNKVGKKWFILSESLQVMRPQGYSLQQATLPPIENPKNINQENRSSKSGNQWEFVKANKRSPLNLNAFGHLLGALEILENNSEDFSVEKKTFFASSILEIGDDLGAGYYSYGTIKRQLYGRARMRSGRLVSRSLLQKSPVGFTLALCQSVEAVSFLCRNLERRAQGVGRTKPLLKNRKILPKAGDVQA
jgi:hypothetical protein